MVGACSGQNGRVGIFGSPLNDLFDVDDSLDCVGALMIDHMGCLSVSPGESVLKGHDVTALMLTDELSASESRVTGWHEVWGA